VTDAVVTPATVTVKSGRRYWRRGDPAV